MSDHGTFGRLDLTPTISKRRYSSSSLPMSFSIRDLFDLLKFFQGLKTGSHRGDSHVVGGARSLLSKARYTSFPSGSSTVACVTELVIIFRTSYFATHLEEPKNGSFLSPSSKDRSMPDPKQAPAIKGESPENL